MFPPYVLEKIYVKGSLKNTEKGAEFMLKNGVDSGTIVGLGPISIDGKRFEAETLTLVSSERETPGDQITRMAPITAYYGSAFTVRINGEKLVAGEHLITISIQTREIDLIRFDIRDAIAA